jgi:DNA modification methylase
LIQLYTYSGEIILDPFMGSGTTALAALKAGRRYVGYEIDEQYITLAEHRIRAWEAEHSQATLVLKSGEWGRGQGPVAPAPPPTPLGEIRAGGAG